MPEGGHIKNISTDFLKRIDIYTPNLLDFFCIKLFAGRKKDQKDIDNMLHHIHHTKRYFHRYKKELRERLEEYIAYNKHNHKTQYAINLYTYFQEKYPYLQPLTLPISS